MKYPSNFAEVPFQNSKLRTAKLLVDTGYLNKSKHKKMFRIEKKLSYVMSYLRQRLRSVIIINDNVDLLNLFRDALEQQKIDTHTSVDPSLALKKIKEDPDQFSLVIIDYSSQIKNRQKGSGKLAKEVKAINKKVKVMLTSGFNFNPVDISKEYDKFLN